MTPAGRLVYVVDDDPSMLKAIGRLLESEEYAVEMFTSARANSLRALPTTVPRASFSI